jgi:hypothetical protein
VTRFEFAFARAYRLAGLPFGISPSTTWASIDDDQLYVHFGPWRVRTALANIAHTTTTGGFTFIKTAGPAHHPDPGRA